ncbi:hypothetical protein C1Y63_11520 [Corynebacterium sp. 13CS0277]|uniref:hypothetical protein n=1 Tax=Corynebacterium sp. 13CS0277 TaxID=2071994 RepID=UPI000D03C2F7|nr:hypothetical protein [Corynebacterium sp. 13CS0277]PRQ10425.1 hypothetical protein C1Y63_11520 [Corynebacterium sp. 13CS0277]
MSAAPILGADIIPLAARRHTPRHTPRAPRTVILRARVDGATPPAVRHLGINDALSLTHLQHALGVAFGVGEGPWLAEDSECIHQLLGEVGCAVRLHWGLWNVDVETLDSYPRDQGTPQALCIGGSGDFLGEEFNPTRINAILTGDDVAAVVLSHTHPDVVDIIERSGIFDFVALVQALGVVDQPPTGIDRPRGVPVHAGRGRDAAWVLLLAAACLGDEATTADIVESTMEALGWDNTPLEAARYLAPGVAQRLASIQAQPSIEQVATYRQLLAHP